MAVVRTPNQIMAMFARKKQKMSAEAETPVSVVSQAEEETLECQKQTFSTHPTYPFPIADLPSRTQPAVVATPKVIKKGDLDLLYFQPFFKPSTASLLYRHLLESLPWYKVTYLARGMTINTPRFTTVFGLDDTAVFEPSPDGHPEAAIAGRLVYGAQAEVAVGDSEAIAGVRVLSAISKQPVPSNVYHQPPRPIPRCLQELKRCVEHATRESYNFVLVNFYADGTHSISPHSDDESFLGLNPCVASLSLGGSRDFVMKHKTRKEVSGEKFVLQNGDMVVMRGTTMANWLHSIPKRVGKTQTTSPRINVTFRKAINAKGSNNYAHYNVGSGPVHRFVQGSMVPIATTN